MVELSETSLLIGLAINGIFTGIGVAIGTWIANSHIIAKIKSIGSKLRGEKLKKFTEEMERLSKEL